MLLRFGRKIFQIPSSVLLFTHQNTSRKNTNRMLLVDDSANAINCSRFLRRSIGWPWQFSYRLPFGTENIYFFQYNLSLKSVHYFFEDNLSLSIWPAWLLFLLQIWKEAEILCVLTAKFWMFHIHLSSFVSFAPLWNAIVGMARFSQVQPTLFECFEVNSSHLMFVFHQRKPFLTFFFLHMTLIFHICGQLLEPLNVWVNSFSMATRLPPFARTVI